MATIRPFRAIRPNTQKLQPLDFLGEEVGTGLELDYLKYRLEPCRSGGLPANRQCREFLEELLASGGYAQDAHPCFYVHELTSDNSTSTGIWALTSLEDLKRGRIARHEQTLVQLEEQLLGYRREVALEGAPVVLAYRQSAEIAQLIEDIKRSEKGFSYRYKDTLHRFWPVGGADMAAAIVAAFERIETVCLADGHHRLGSAERLHAERAQWICSLYYAQDQIRIDPFHRLVRRTAEDPVTALVEALAKHFYISAIPANRSLRPSQKGRFGMCLKGSWYQLDKRNADDGLCDEEFLQLQVLYPAFGIDDARTDGRLECHAGEGSWKRILLEIQKDPLCVVFTLCAMEAQELFWLSDKGTMLPPKSTYITPKAPFGLLMYRSGQEGEGE